MAGPKPVEGAVLGLDVRLGLGKTGHASSLAVREFTATAQDDNALETLQYVATLFTTTAKGFETGMLGHDYACLL